jgi:hypothetical protein
MPDASYLRAQIDRLRRLLQGISDEQTRQALKKMLADYKEQLQRLRGGQKPGQDGDP